MTKTSYVNSLKFGSHVPRRDGEIWQAPSRGGKERKDNKTGPMAGWNALKYLRLCPSCLGSYFCLGTRVVL